MADNYKIDTEEALLEKINEECEVLESIYAGEGAILAKPSVFDLAEADLSTNSSGKSNEEED